MKKMAGFILVVMFLFLFAPQAIACSSFAVYSNDHLYGMNFDYPDVEIKYAISEFNDLKVFHMDFNVFGKLAPTVGMNDNGLFAAIQMQYPEQPTIDRLEGNQIDMHDFGINMLFEYDDVKDIDNYLKDKMVVNQYLTCHDLFADKTGEAMVVEAGENNNLISKIQNNFIVMTNFSNEELKTKSYKDIFEVGSDRYGKAYEYISKNKGEFDIDNAFEVLKSTVQEYGTYPTQSSMVFDPENREIYIAIKRNFNKIWKVSLKEGYIESYKGFKSQIRLELDEKGVLLEELQKYVEDYSDSKNFEAASVSAKSDDGIERHTNLNYLIFIGIAALFILAVIVIKRGRFSKNKE